MRCFVAILLEAALRAALAQAAVRLCADEHTLRRVGAENLHLTLQFLGEVLPQAMEDIETALARAAAGAAAFDVEFGGSGGFPTSRRPRIVWIGTLRGADELSELARGVARELRPLGFVPDKPFSPHVTVARARKGAARLQDLSLGFERPVGVQRVQSIHLMQSELLPGGARYRSLYRAELNSDSI
jgi:2'-5' RNA ligase